MTVCIRCGRRGERGFVAAGSNRPDDPNYSDQWACGNLVACRRRQGKPKEARKIATYSCGCARAVLGVPGQPPRPPDRCPDHDAEITAWDTVDPKTGKAWRG